MELEGLATRPKGRPQGQRERERALLAEGASDGFDSSARKPSSNSKIDVTVSQGFEWIPHGDASARKRARAHVTRGIRRDKAAQAKQANADRHHNEDDTSPSHTNKTASLATDVMNITDELPRGQTQELDIMSSDLLLFQTPGHSKADPFSSMPIALSPGTHALVDHFLSGVAPVSFHLDRYANFQPVKSLAFECALSTPSGFHLVLSAAAYDIAVKNGRQDSLEAVAHRGKALELVRTSLMPFNQGQRDETIAAVAILVGCELLFGTPKDVNMHLKGLASMVKVRGGLRSFKSSNPTLYYAMSWYDYSSSCNLLSKRHLALPTQETSFLCTNPIGIPLAIVQSLPLGYDLHLVISNLFIGVQSLASLPYSYGLSSPPDSVSTSPSMSFSSPGSSSSTSSQSCPSPQFSHPLSSSGNESQNSKSAAFISGVDNSLYTSYCTPEISGNRSRRRHILQSYHVLVLIYTSFISRSEHLSNSSKELFLLRLSNIIIIQDPRWGSSVMDLLRFLSPGYSQQHSHKDEKDSSRDNSLYEKKIKKVIEASIPLEWNSWQSIKTSLFSFFITEEDCNGRLQALWKLRFEQIQN